MLNLYTSYFAKLKYLPNTIVPIAICGKSPDWYHGLEFKALAPKYDFFMKWKSTGDNDYYIKCYNEQVLDNLCCYSVVDKLVQMSGGRDIALICYEKPGDFCHRHLVSKWLNAYKFKCSEYEFD